MTIADLLPFDEAVKSLAARNVLPTALDSAGLKQLGGAFHRQNFTSAQTLITDLLDAYKEKVGTIINPTTELRADRITPQNPTGATTTGINPATARAQVKELMQSLGMQPTGAAGGVSELASDARINLVIKTNTELSQGAGFAIQSNDPAVLEAFPCWELYRLEGKTKERDWETRWATAAAISGDTDAARVLSESNRMVARKDSPIWQSLGDGPADTTDGLGNPYPPFAFNSGMWTRNIAYDDAEQLGLVNLATQVESNLPDDLAQLFSTAA